MNKKFFDFIEKVDLTQKDIKSIEKERQKKLKNHSKRLQEKAKEKVKKEVGLKYVYGRVIISIDLDYKNGHTMENGERLYIGRQYNNLNRRETEPVNAFVISAEYIPSGSEILIHPNAIIESNKLYGFEEDETTVRYYSIPEDQCYLWKDEIGDWRPLKGYATGLRLFEEYKGPIVGIEPKKIKNVLYITSGSLKGKVVRTLHASDYEIVFMGDGGQEERVIRCRHYEGEFNEREEVICVDEKLTQMVEKMELMVGISKKDAKYIVFSM